MVIGNPVIFQCTVTHKEGNVIWSKDGVDLSQDVTITNGNQQYSVIGNYSLGEYNLHIDDITENEGGVYECRVTAADNSPEIRAPPVILTVERKL